MQNSASPQSSRPEFSQAAAMPDGQRYALEIEAMNNPRLKAGFEQLRERQRMAIKAEQERFERERPETLETLTRNLMDARLNQMSPHLRPKHLAGVSRQDIEQSARKDARATLAGIETEHFKTIKSKFLENQKRFLERARSSQSRQNFNRAARQENEAVRERKNRDDANPGRSR